MSQCPVVFVKMVFRCAKPILMTVGFVCGHHQWNSWFDAYLYTSDQALKPMQSILVEILNQYQTGASTSQAMSNAKAGVTVTPDSIRMAATMVATLPIIMVYPFVQKYFVKGIMLGCRKGMTIHPPCPPGDSSGGPFHGDGVFCFFPSPMAKS